VLKYVFIAQFYLSCTRIYNLSSETLCNTFSVFKTGYLPTNRIAWAILLGFVPTIFLIFWICVMVCIQYRLVTDWKIGVRFLTAAGNFSLRRRVHTGSGAHPTPIQWVPGVLSLGVKRPVCEDDHLPPSSAKVKECVELYFHSTNAPSWRGAWLSTRTTLPYLYLCMQYIENLKGRDHSKE
jgi:hypothetical protein